ncbi:hypothetical protein KY330_00725 [Candidatus Woesearchaeota archaeon]|nr:hypothetical protein [Candidatus Woesearchaeota archaeon]
MNAVKKAQIQHVFIYILAIVVIGLTLILGYRGIKSVIQGGNEVALLNFQKQLENDIERLSAAYRNREMIPYDVPGDYKQICFVDVITPDVTYPSELEAYPFIKESVDSNLESNVWLVSRRSEDPLGEGKLGDIEVDNGFECVDIVGGKIRLSIEGTGGKAKVKGLEAIS